MITVIDDLLGSGKTTNILRTINENKDKKYLFVTPLLTECDRVCSIVGFVQPSREPEQRQKSLTELLLAGRNIVCTHQLFVNFADYHLVEDYHLILDETLDCTTAIGVKESEFSVMREYNLIVEHPAPYNTTRIEWNPNNDLQNTRIDKLYSKFFANSLEMYKTEKGAVAFLINHKLLRSCCSVTILTYNFDNTEMDLFLRFHGFEYEKKNYDFTQFEQKNGERYRDLITVVNNPRMNETESSRKSKFTKRWYSEEGMSEIAAIRKNMANFYKNITKTKSAQNMWGVFSKLDFKNYQEDHLSGVWETKSQKEVLSLKCLLEQPPYKSVGYTTNIDPESLEYKEAQCFVPVNSRATNLYGDRTAVAYLVNLHMSPNIRQFFKASIGVAPCDDVFALNALSQWLFRSAIRNGKPITLYIPSKRMRHLLLTWLGYTEDELF